MNCRLLFLFSFCLYSSCKSSSNSGVGLIPIIDSHVHLSPDPDSVKRALGVFDANGITRFCAKSAGFPPSPRFQATLEIKRQLGDRFSFFSNVDWRGVDDPNWSVREAARLEAAVRQGASGVKIFKALGLGVRTADGRLFPVDDSRMDPILDKAADLGAIVAIHTADPQAFFRPPTPDNERYLELLFAPSWGFFGQDYLSFDSLLAARDRLVERHPKTTFLLIHLASNSEDLDYVDRLLTTYPNVYVDTSARVPEIGRNDSERVRNFFIKHQDRILFGTDIMVSADELQLGSLSVWPDDDADADRFFAAHREYFETDHRQIDHPTLIQGLWKVDAVNLPEKVLRKFYVENAEKLIWRIGVL